MLTFLRWLLTSFWVLIKNFWRILRRMSIFNIIENRIILIQKGASEYKKFSQKMGIEIVFCICAVREVQSKCVLVILISIWFSIEFKIFLFICIKCTILDILKIFFWLKHLIEKFRRIVLDSSLLNTYLPAKDFNTFLKNFAIILTTWGVGQNLQNKNKLYAIEMICCSILSWW